MLMVFRSFSFSFRVFQGETRAPRITKDGVTIFDAGEEEEVKTKLTCQGVKPHFVKRTDWQRNLGHPRRYDEAQTLAHADNMCGNEEPPGATTRHLGVLWCLLNTVCWWTTLQSVDDLQKLRLQKRYGGLLVMIDAGTTDTLNWSSQSRALSRDKFESPSFCLGRPSRRDGAQIDTTVAFWSAQVQVLGTGSWWRHCKVTRTSFCEPLHHTALNQITGVGQDQKGNV